MAIEVGGMFKRQKIEKPVKKVTSFSEIISTRPEELEETKPIDIRSIIKVSGQVKEPVKKSVSSVSFKDLMVQRDLELKAQEQFAIESQIEEIKKAVEVEKKTTQPQKDNGNIIKPKYLEDKSVFYKNSGYLQDLLGEGN